MQLKWNKYKNLMKVLILEENFRRHLEAFASEVFIYIYIYLLLWND